MEALRSIRLKAPSGTGGGIICQWRCVWWQTRHETSFSSCAVHLTAFSLSTAARSRRRFAGAYGVLAARVAVHETAREEMW